MRRRKLNVQLEANFTQTKKNELGLRIQFYQLLKKNYLMLKIDISRNVLTLIHQIGRMERSDRSN